MYRPQRPVGRGRGRASVLPAWMTDPSLAKEAQSVANYKNPSINTKASRFDQKPPPNSSSPKKRSRSSSEMATSPSGSPARNSYHHDPHNNHLKDQPPSPKHVPLSSNDGKSPPFKPRHASGSPPTRVRKLQQKEQSRNNEREENYDLIRPSHSEVERQRERPSNKEGFSRRDKSPSHRSFASEERNNKRRCVESEDIPTCSILCSRLNELRNLKSEEKRRIMFDIFRSKMIHKDFVYETASGNRYGIDECERRVIMGRVALKTSVEVTRRLFIEKDASTSYCLESEWEQDGSYTNGNIALYECRDGKISRYLLFKDSKNVCSPNRPKVSYNEFRECRPFATVYRYLLKKGVAPSATCYYTDCVSGQSSEHQLGDI